MFTLLARNWWALALRGAVAILFGILALVWPQLTVAVLVLLFAAYALVDGIFAIFSAFRHRESSNWWLLLIEGLISAAAGVVAFVWPAITALVLLYVIAAWALFTGVLEIIAAIRLRNEIEGEWLLVLSGIASVIFGALLFLFPGSGAVAVAWLIGTYAIIFGILLVILSLRLRSMQQDRGQGLSSA